MKAVVAACGVVCAIVLLFTASAVRERGPVKLVPSATLRSDGVVVAPGVTAAQVEALLTGDSGSGGPTVTHPTPGAVFPSSFPAPRLQWSEHRPGRIFMVQVARDGEVLYRSVTRRLEDRPAPAAWNRIRATPGEVTISVIAGRVEPDGRTAGPLERGPTATLRIAAAAEDPTGMILFGAKHRPAGKSVGAVPLLMMHLRVDGYDMKTFQRRVVFRSSYGPEPTRMHPERLKMEQGDERGRPGGRPGGGPAEKGGGPEGDGPHGDDEGLTTTQCVSCHAVSPNGKYVAVFSQTAEEAPARFDAPNGFLTVLTMPKREVVIQLPHAFLPQFNPANPDLLAFGEVDETIGTKDQMIVRHSDLHILDLKTRKHYPLPGADLPDRVENQPMWSPDGSELAFIRTKAGQVWHGAAGKLEIATIRFNGGKGGTAVPLKGASANGRSNFLPTWSRDGRWIVFTQADQGFFSQESSDLYIVPSAGGAAVALGCNSRLTESWHRFSPDGRWLAFVTNREDIRRPHIWVARFDTTAGTCAPPIQTPVSAGPGAHTHAFSWTPHYDWLDAFGPAAP